MRVQLLFFDGCPNWKLLDERLGAVTAAAGVDVEHVRVETGEDARRLGFTGSPSIRIDGRDPFPSDEAVAGLTCRVYMTPDGPAGAPTVGQLREALGIGSR